MRIAITGARGQLGTALARQFESSATLGLFNRPDYDVVNPRIVQDIADFRPTLVIHTAAMTDVDGCARDPARAFQINALGTRDVAQGCARAGAPLLCISTNEVFDGEKDSPYLETDAPNPRNPYGASKRAGEQFVQATLKEFYIVRTAWLYARGGNKFPDKVIARARADGKLAYVDDELGNPTYAPDLACAIAQLIGTRAFGIYHLVNEGVASRYDWARRVLALADLAHVPIARVKLKAHRRDSTPPRNGALANTRGAALGIRLRNWEDALEEFFTDADRRG